MKINTYTIDELDGLLNSDIYKKSDVLPLSPMRAASHKNNPRAEGSMPVLFTMEEEGQVIAYRSLLPDLLYKDDNPYEFAWLSGNFVSPEHRRKGLSTTLFKAVEDAWEGRLMYTNYAPASKAVYDKTGVFALFLEKVGARYYLRSSMQSLLKDRVGMSKVLSFTDIILNGLHDGKIRRSKFELPDDLSVTLIEPNGDTISGIISEQLPGSLFRRGASEFSWIYDHPWLTSNKQMDLAGEYHFSWKAEIFENLLYRIDDKTKGEAAFLWINIHNEKLSVPYFFSPGGKLLFASRQIILEQMVKYQCAYVTTWHPDLVQSLKTKPNPFLHSRIMPQRYFVHEKLRIDLPEKIELFDGDGDCVFS